MSDTPAAAPPTESWQPIPPTERRVLGVLIEKQKTSKSADAYPMTLNGITTGCNQKSNRDPVLDLDEDDVEEALAATGRRGLTMKMTGSRVDRWRHLLYEAWKVTKVEMAILAELLLRGPQTEGDLRGRASRMDDIPDVEALRAMVASLAERGLVVYVTPAGRRGTVVTHGFHTAEELAAAKASAGSVGSDDAAPRASGGELAALREAVARLEARVAVLEAKAG